MYVCYLETSKCFFVKIEKYEQISSIFETKWAPHLLSNNN